VANNPDDVFIEAYNATIEANGGQPSALNPIYELINEVYTKKLQKKLLKVKSSKSIKKSIVTNAENRNPVKGQIGWSVIFDKELGGVDISFEVYQSELNIGQSSGHIFVESIDIEDAVTIYDIIPERSVINNSEETAFINAI
jgi:hypothetical protein